MRRIAAAALSVVLLPLAACSGKPEDCITLDPGVAQAIVDGANGSDLELYRNSGRAIASGTGVYYVAYRISAGGEDAVGVWATTKVTTPVGPIRSVDGFAQQFTDWPVLEGTNGSDGANDAEACLD